MPIAEVQKYIEIMYTVTLTLTVTKHNTDSVSIGKQRSVLQLTLCCMSASRLQRVKTSKKHGVSDQKYAS